MKRQDRKTKEWSTVRVNVRAEARKSCYFVKVHLYVYIWRNRRYLHALIIGRVT